MNPTTEQIKIIKEENNVVVTANPGSGKTYTIIEKIGEISKELLNYQGVIAISFTRKASEELGERYRRKNNNNRNHFFGTIDKFYLTEIIIPFSKLLFDYEKSFKIKDSFDEHPHYKRLKKLKGNREDEELTILLHQALEEGLIFLEISGETAWYILRSVPESLIYLKAKYTHVFIDEYQDCGQIQHDIFLKLVNEGIKGIAVGDLNQAIYAFTNRYSKYLLSLMKSSDFMHLEITHNHRCHKSISNYSLELLGVNRPITDEKRVIKARVDGNDEHVVRAIENKIDRIKQKYNIKHNNEIAILCKSNVSAERVSNFLKLDNKLFVDTPLDKVDGKWAMLFNDLLSSYFLYKVDEITAIDFASKYLSEELDYANFRKGLRIIHELFTLSEDELKKNIHLFYNLAITVDIEEKQESIIERLISILKNKKELESFKVATKKQINIMTLHKSKGLEFKCVFLMDTYKWILPYEGYKSTQEDLEQALNLHYVGITRAIDVCFIMLGKYRFRPSNKDYIETVESPFLHRNNTIGMRKNVDW